MRRQFDMYILIYLVSVYRSHFAFFFFGLESFRWLLSLSQVCLCSVSPVGFLLLDERSLGSNVIPPWEPALGRTGSLPMQSSRKACRSSQISTFLFSPPNSKLPGFHEFSPPLQRARRFPFCPVSQDVIPQPLLDEYVSMTDPARAQSVDTDIAKHCAYSLPGVALTLGRQNWHCLKDTYETLASDVQVKAAFAKAHVEIGRGGGLQRPAGCSQPVYWSLRK